MTTTQRENSNVSMTGGKKVWWDITILNSDTGELFTLITKKSLVPWDTIGRALMLLGWKHISWDVQPIYSQDHKYRILRRCATYGKPIHGGWIQGGEANG